MASKTVGCLRCGVRYDPARPHISHICGVIGDYTARRLEELIFENRSRIEAVDRRLREIEATRSRHPAAPQAQDAGLEDARPKRVIGGDALTVRAPAPLTLADLRDAEPVKKPFDRKQYHNGYIRR